MRRSNDGMLVTSISRTITTRCRVLVILVVMVLLQIEIVVNLYMGSRHDILEWEKHL